jgi:hypothetical protein
MAADIEDDLPKVCNCAVAPLAAPSDTKHRLGYALDIQDTSGRGGNAQIVAIAKALGSSFELDEKSHVHVEFAKGVVVNGRQLISIQQSASAANQCRAERSNVSAEPRAVLEGTSWEPNKIFEATGRTLAKVFDELF